MSMRRLAVGSIVLWALGSPLGAQSTATIAPVADAFVTTGPSGNLAGNNYGNLGALGVSGSGAARSGSGFRGVFDTVIRFDLAAVKAGFDAAYGAGLWTVQSITLRLTTVSPANNALFNDNSTGQFSVVWMQDDTWGEGTGATPANGITYATLPGFLGTGDQAAGTFTFDAAVSGATGTATTYALTPGSGLIADVLGGGQASFELLAASNGVSYLVGSRINTGNAPQLAVTAVAVPEPAGAGCATGALLLALAGKTWRRRRAIAPSASR